MKLVHNKAFRRVAAAGILLLTASMFIVFFVRHPEYWQQLQNVRAKTVVAVLVGDAVLMGLLAGIYRTCIYLCGKEIGQRENFLLTAYSSIINFFGPLQSGPGIRAVYLKKRLAVRLRDYTLATLCYYGLFACISVLFLLGGAWPWWLTVLATIVCAVISWLVIRKFARRDKHSDESTFSLRAKLLSILISLTFLQVLVQACVFFYQLHTLNPSIHFMQAISYTGAADLSLFVSLTPGAIGFRETFLVFSQSIHHISTGNILSANLIDRSVYLLFLGLLFLLVLALHAQKRFSVKRSTH